jgi:hypothetical protein
MKSQLAPIVRDSQRLLREAVITASVMPANFRQMLGAKLRDDSLEAYLLVQKAFRLGSRPAEARPLVEKIEKLNDGIQALLQVGYEVKAIGSAGRLKELSDIATAVGRQAGGWLKAIRAKHPNEQVPVPSAAPESLGTLSTRGASSGAQ